MRLFPLILIATLLMPISAWAYTVPERFLNGVTVVHSDDMAPMAFAGVNGAPKGFVVDYWKVWSERTGVPVTFRLMNWQQGLELVRKDEMAVHGGLYVTPRRMSYLQYAPAIFPMDAYLFTVQGGAVRSVDDLSGKVVGVLAKGASSELVAAKLPEARTRMFPSYTRMLVGLIDNEVECIAGDYQTIMYLAGTLGALKQLMPMALLSEENLHPAVARGRDELFGLVEHGCSLISEDEREEILHQWFVLEEQHDHTLVYMALGAVAVFLLALGVFYFGSQGLVKRDSA